MGTWTYAVVPYNIIHNSELWIVLFPLHPNRVPELLLYRNLCLILFYNLSFQVRCYSR